MEFAVDTKIQRKEATDKKEATCFKENPVNPVLRKWERNENEAIAYANPEYYFFDESASLGASTVIQRKSPEAQMLPQEEIEDFYYRKLHLYAQMRKYGGLCGGWTAGFLKNPREAIKMYQQMGEEVFHDRDKNSKAFKKSGKSKRNAQWFRKIMLMHYVMNKADAITDPEADDEGELTAEIAGFDRERHQNMMDQFFGYLGGYDQENYKIQGDSNREVVGKILDEIKELGDGRKAYIASPSHHMAVMKISGRNFLLCETQNFGMGKVNLNNLAARLRGIAWLGREDKYYGYFHEIDSIT